MGRAQPAPQRPYIFQPGKAAVGDQVNLDFDPLYSILSGGVGDASIAENAAIAGSKLADASILGSKLATGAANANLAPNTVPGSVLVNGSVTGTQIATSSVTNANLASKTLTGGAVQDGTLGFGTLNSQAQASSYSGVFSLNAGTYQPFQNVTVASASAGFLIASYGGRIDMKDYSPSYFVSVILEANDATGSAANTPGPALDSFKVYKTSPNGQNGSNHYVGSTFVGAVGATANGTNHVFRVIFQAITASGMEITEGKLQVVFIPNS